MASILKQHKSLSPPRKGDIGPDVKKSTMKDNGSVIKIDFEEEVKIMRSAHKILIKKHNDYTGVKNDYDRLPGKVHEDFMNFTTVKGMLDDTVIPVINTIPKLKQHIQNLQTQITQVSGQTKSAFMELKNFQEEIKQLNAFNQSMERMRQEMDYQTLQTKNQFIDVNNQFLKVGDDRSQDLECMQVFKQRLQTQDLSIEEFKVQIDRTQQKYESIFKEWFEENSRDAKIMRESMQNLDERQEKVELSTKEDRAEIKSILDKTVKKIFEDESKNQFRIQTLERKQALTDKKLLTLKKLESNMDEVLRQLGDSGQQAKFISETLPLLNHLQICEALDKVVGSEFRGPLQTFEMKKLDELHKYITCRADTSCIKIMHERLLTFMRFFKKHQKGVFSFTFGEDVYSSMTQEEIGFMHQSYELSIKKRFDVFNSKNVNFKEALDQCLVDPEKQSPVVMKHKISRLDAVQLKQLKDSVLVQRIQKEENYDDILLTVPKPMAGSPLLKRAMRDGRDSTNTEDRGANNETPNNEANKIVFPDKVFVMKRERLKHYQRLDLKYQALFERAYQEFKQLKNDDFVNFSRTTQMTMMLNQELDTVRKFLEQNNESLEDLEEKQENLSVLLDKKVENLQTLIDKKIAKANSNTMQNMEKQHTLQQQIAQNQVKLENTVNENIQMKKQLTHMEEVLKQCEQQNQNLAANHAKLAKTLKTNFGISQNLKGQSRGSVIKNEGGAILSELQNDKSIPREESLESSKSQGMSATNVLSDSVSRSNEPSSPVNKIKSLKSAANVIRFGNRLAAGAKQKAKLEQQNKRENARRIEELAIQRKQEREIRIEQAREEKGIVAGSNRHLIDEQAQQAKQIKEEAQAEKIKRKSELLQALKCGSRCSQLGQKFLTQLGNQKVQSEIQAEKMEQKIQKAKLKGGIQKSNSRSEAKSGLISRERTMQSAMHSAESHCNDTHENSRSDSQNAIVIHEGDEIHDDFEDDDESDLRFVNPFAAPPQKPGLDLEQLEEQLKPRLDAIWEAINQNKDDILPQIDELRDQMPQGYDELKSQISKDNDLLKDQISSADKKIKELLDSFPQFQAAVRFDLKAVSEQMEFEKQEIVKQRVATKKEITIEIQKVQASNDASRLEFQRINSILERIKNFIPLICQDSMLMQMLSEQDILDRKQIGLFGLKKNQQILGTNQYSMTNNLMNAQNHQQNDQSFQTDQKKFWDLRNKDKSYKEVVHSPTAVGENARGQDLNKSIKDQNQLNKIQPRHQSPIHDQNSMPIADPNIDIQRTNQTITSNEVNYNSSFKSRFDSNQQHNVLFIDRNCASCVTGMAPQILTQIKLACLSYISSPIVYKKGTNKDNHLELQVHDIIQIKEYILQKCQNVSQELEEVYDSLQSTFGTCEDPLDMNGNPIKAQNVVNAEKSSKGRQSINLNLFQDQYNMINGRVSSQIQIGEHPQIESPLAIDDSSPQGHRYTQPTQNGSPGDTLKKYQLSEMLHAANNEEAGLSRESLKLGGGTNTIEMSRDTSPISPALAGHKFKGKIGVEKIKINSDTLPENSPKNDENKNLPVEQQNDKKFLSELQQALSKLNNESLTDKPKYNIGLIQQFMEENIKNRHQLSVQNFLQSLIIQRIEAHRLRHEKSHLLKLKSYKLNFCQQRDQRMKQANLFESQTIDYDQSVQSFDQKSSYKSKSKTKYTYKIPRDSTQPAKKGGYSTLGTKTNKNDKSNDIKTKQDLRQRGNVSVQGLNSVNVYLQNQNILPGSQVITPQYINNTHDRTGNQSQVADRNILSGSIPKSPFVVDHAGMSSTKNSRYDSRGATEINLDRDGKDYANLIKSQQFSQINDLARFGISPDQVLQKRMGTSGSNYPDQGIKLPIDLGARNSTQLSNRPSVRTKSAIGIQFPNKNAKKAILLKDTESSNPLSHINPSIRSSVNNNRNLNSMSTRIPIASPINSPVVSDTTAQTQGKFGAFSKTVSNQ